MDIKSIGVLTSGGDAPGMNACIRAVTRAAIFEGWKVYGIYRGWEGLIMGNIKELTTENVSNTIQRGGTILKTARSDEFRTPEGREKAYANIRKFGIDALIVIGGNGSLAGAQLLASEHDVTVIGLPGTIDNDLYGTDSTIGYDTALNTIVECVARRRATTAYSLSRSWEGTRGSSRRTALSPQARRLRSSPRTTPTSTSSRLSSDAEYARARTAA